MVKTLPPILPTSSSKLPSRSVGIPRAQNVSVSKLQQRKDVEATRVSMSQLMRSKAAGGAGQEESLYSDAQRDEIRDRLRYTYMQSRMREKKTAELAAKVEKPSKYGFPSISTGRLTRRVGPAGVERQIYRQIRKHIATYKNISPKDRKYFLDMVLPHGEKLAPGKGFGFGVRRQMKTKVEMDRRSGAIGFEDAKDFKRMIDQLP